MKKEEEKSYVGLYVILSFILAATNVWALWNEIVGKRPWKDYQTRFYELEFEDAKKKYDDAVLVFEQQDEQDLYKAAEQKLGKAKKEFKNSKIQREYKKTLTELSALDKKELAPLRFESIVTRNKMMEAEYQYGKHKRDESKRHESKRHILELDDKGKALAEKIKSIEEKRARLQEKLDGFKSNIVRYTKELESHSSNMLEYKETMVKLGSRRPQLQVYQVHLEELNEVDRCMSCHVGINNKDSVSEEQPYARHPRREVYLGKHPPERFGCALCHEGQARATTSPKKAHGEVEYWLEPMHKGKMAQSSCVKCHDKGEELVGGEEIWKAIKLVEELGCYGCHPIEGFDKDKNRMIGPDLIEISSKVNPGWLVSWLQGPKSFRTSTRMPDFKLNEDDAMAITSYLWQNSEGFEPGEPKEFDEETIEEGAFIFESIGCLACHSDIEEDGKIHGPNLARIGEKINYEYLVSWLLEPKKHQPRTRMPDLRLDEEDAQYIAAFLMSLKSGYLEILSDEDKVRLTDEKTASKGKNLINRYGCFGCHKIQGMEKKTKIGVELSAIGSKHIHLFDYGLLEKKLLHEVGLESSHENIGEARRAWLRAKLTNPRQFDEGRYKRPEDKLRMPDFNLTKDEIETLLILLTGMREGALPESYIAKLEGEKKSLVEGKRVIDKFNCMGCHQFSIDTLYLKDGVVVKGMVKLEEEENLYFQLWEDNEGLGRKAGETVQIVNEDIKSMSRSEGGDIGEFIIDYHVEVEGRVAEEARVFTPPVLYGEGKKVQGPWLFDFLEEPVALRPWLDVRMPTFKMTEDEATILTGYFAALEKEEYPYEYIVETKEKYLEEKEKEKPGYLTMAEHLFNSKNVNCASCHVRGDITPEGEPADWAPDLSKARERLKPDWIVNWLLDPQLIQPGTKMPKFFREGVFQDIFPGTPEEQAVALKDLLMNLPEEMLKQQADESESEEEE